MELSDLAADCGSNDPQLIHQLGNCSGIEPLRSDKALSGSSWSTSIKSASAPAAGRRSRLGATFSRRPVPVRDRKPWAPIVVRGASRVATRTRGGHCSLGDCTGDRSSGSLELGD